MMLSVCAVVQVEIMSWVSSKHNMGMALTRQTWSQLKACTEVQLVVVLIPHVSLLGYLHTDYNLCSN